jgi:hypothetical protein
MAPSSISSTDRLAPDHRRRDATGKTQQAFDALYTMMEKDFTYFYRDYLYNDDCSDGATDTAAIHGKVTSDDRTKIVDWCYSVVDLSQLNRENVAIAMNIVDRFMSNPCQLPSIGISPHFSCQKILHNHNMYQLLAVSALYIAIKINGHGQVILSAEKLAAISQGTYSVENIEAMERTILSCLSWRVCAPTAFQVGCTILELIISQVQEDTRAAMVEISRWESIREELAFQTENAVRDYQLAIQFPSTVAFMAILNAIENVQNMNDGKHNILMNALLSILVEVKNLTTKERHFVN